MDRACLRAVPGGVQVLLAVRPRAGRSEIVGVLGDRLKVRLAAPPGDGKANEALRELLAERLGVNRSSVTIASGETGTKKTVVVLGIDAQVAAVRLGVGA